MVYTSHLKDLIVPLGFLVGSDRITPFPLLLAAARALFALGGGFLFLETNHPGNRGNGLNPTN